MNSCWFLGFLKIGAWVCLNLVELKQEASRVSAKRVEALHLISGNHWARRNRSIILIESGFGSFHFDFPFKTNHKKPLVP